MYFVLHEVENLPHCHFCEELIIWSSQLELECSNKCCPETTLIPAIISERRKGIETIQSCLIGHLQNKVWGTKTDNLLPYFNSLCLQV